MWVAFKDFIFFCINGVFNFIGDWGMAILIVTLIFRLILFPLMQKQIKSSYKMQKVQPLIQEIQTKYANEPLRAQEELQKIYAETKFNPVAGCLPMFLQMPIFIALFQVLQEMGTRTGGADYCFYSLIPDLTLTPSISFSHGFGVFFPYLILLIVFAGATFLPIVLQQMQQPNNPQRKQMFIMSGVMTIMMIWIGWNAPGGVLLFWGVSSLFGVAQQQISMKVMKKKEQEEEAKIIDKPIKVDVTRKVKKKRPTKNH